MNSKVIQETIQLSLEGKITFPEVVAMLAEIGVESYHVDLVRSENRYYWPSGESVLEAVPHAYPVAARAFSGGDVRAAIGAIQQGQIDYLTFVERILAAGCVYYIAYISGKRVAYLGRDGDCHVEHFPSSK